MVTKAEGYVVKYKGKTSNVSGYSTPRVSSMYVNLGNAKSEAFSLRRFGYEADVIRAEVIYYDDEVVE